MTLEALARKLFVTLDGVEVHRLVKRLCKQGADDKETVIQILMDYAKRGPLQHWRSFVIPDIIRMIELDANEYRSFFEQTLRDPITAYWSVDGLVKTAGRESYETLMLFALDSSHSTEARANAIKCLAGHSGQTFMRGRPSDPGHWSETELPLDEVRQWAQAGYPSGSGFPSPPRHPDLDAPTSELDRLAQSLERKLAKARAKGQDPANPDNWLVPAAPDDLAVIQSKWTLPDIYLEFLRKFSPLRVTVTGRGFGTGLHLFGAGELVQGQAGYSFNPVRNEPILEWPEAYVVIASMAGDPFVLDLQGIQKGDAPVLSALHGQGEWAFEKVTARFLTFLRQLTR